MSTEEYTAMATEILLDLKEILNTLQKLEAKLPEPLITAPVENQDN